MVWVRNPRQTVKHTGGITEESFSYCRANVCRGSNCKSGPRRARLRDFSGKFTKASHTPHAVITLFTLTAQGHTQSLTERSVQREQNDLKSIP